MRHMLCFAVSMFVSLFSAQLLAADSEGEQVSTIAQLKAATDKEAKKIIKDNNLEYYASDNVTNQIPYFDNRFRIDALLEEITLIFYRKLGTPPIILVRPDGSKLKVNNYPEDKVEWFDDRTFDMIKIKKPMPGPWQAIGDILPESKIMVVTDIIIDVEPMPEVVLSGETLKMEGRLINGEQFINDPLFREVVNLDVDFFSTNNSDYDNFGAEPIRLTTFRDDGEELDEYARDGIFTGEFKLTFAPGEWLPIYLVKLPMMTRELKQKPIVLHENPIKIKVDATTDTLGQHVMHFNIDPRFVDPDSVLFQGQITLPDRTRQPFSIMEGAGETREEKFGYVEAGIHRVNVNVFGRMKSGREFVLSVPEYTFNVERSDDEPIISINYDGEASSGGSESEVMVTEGDSTQAILARERANQERIADDKQQTTIIIIVVANLFILAMAIGGYYLVGFIRKRKNQKATDKTDKKAKKAAKKEKSKEKKKEDKE